VYYTFFETGDEQFFSGLMKAFCSFYVNNIVDLYNAVKQKKSNILDVDKYKLDMGDLKQHMNEERRKRLNIFNCSQHLMAAECLNYACKAEHTTVLAKDQQERFERLMATAKNSYCRSNYPGEKKKVWKEIQRVFQKHEMFEFFKLKTLNFEVTDPKEYLGSYIEETNKLNPAEGYAYVRTSASSSDFPGFFKGTNLPRQKVLPCDILQSV
jgi:hypothetical protein